MSIQTPNVNPYFGARTKNFAINIGHSIREQRRLQEQERVQRQRLVPTDTVSLKRSKKTTSKASTLPLQTAASSYIPRKVKSKKSWNEIKLEFNKTKGTGMPASELIYSKSENSSMTRAQVQEAKKTEQAAIKKAALNPKPVTVKQESP